MFRNRFNLRKVVAIAICLAGVATFSGCDKEENPIENPNNPPTEDPVVINGVRWAKRNVGTKNTFVPSVESYGNYYTWDEAVNACPSGWRLPTVSEIERLLDTSKVRTEWTNINGVNGRIFTDRISGNNIFLPAAGWNFEGKLSNLGKEGNYWTGMEIDNSSAYFFPFDNEFDKWYYLHHGDFSYGCLRNAANSMRCVQATNALGAMSKNLKY